MDSTREDPSQAGSHTRAQARTRKSVATLEKIMEAAAALMAERGGVDFQMSEVSERCEMSKGALYYYFSDRTSLVHAVFDRAVDDLVHDIEATVAEAPCAMDSVRGLVETVAESLRPGTPLSLAMMARGRGDDPTVLPDVESRAMRIVSIFSVQLERAKAEGLVRRDVDTKLAAVSIMGTLVLLGHEAAGGTLGDGRPLAGTVLSLAFEGMGTEQARALLADGGDACGTDDVERDE